MVMSEIMSRRATGQLPLSIATSLAIESLLGIHPEKETDTPPITKYQELWVNLRTLVRNMLGSLEKEDKKFVTPDEITEALLSEMDVITTETKSNGITHVVFYGSELNLTKYRRAKLRALNTDRQKHEDALIAKSVGDVLRQYKENPSSSFEVKRFSLKLKPTRKDTKTVILTHQCIDLLAWSEFKSLTLLESHTGNFKDRDLWYTKYYNGKDLNRLPFTEKLLQIFGDSEIFSPMDKHLRDDILELANKYNWTPLTTNEKVSFTIRSLKNKYAVDLYHTL